MLKIIIHISIALLVISCNSKSSNDKKEAVISQDIPPNVEKKRNEIKERRHKEKAKRDSIMHIRNIYCRKWEKERHALLIKKKELFNSTIYQPAVEKGELTTANLHLLNQIKDNISQAEETLIKKYPIFKYPTHFSYIEPSYTIDLHPTYTESSSFQFIEPHWEIVSKKGAEIRQRDTFSIYTDIDGFLIDSTGPWKFLDTSKAEYIIHSDLKTTLASKDLDNRLNVYSETHHWQTQVTKTGLVWGDCRSFHFYKLENQSDPSLRKPLLASPLKLEMELQNYPNYDSLHKQTFKKINDETCKFDCLYKYEQSKSFGMLKGIPNLYLAYTEDDLSTGEWVHYPQRSIGMIVGDSTVIELWKQTKDNFGCSCL